MGDRRAQIRNAYKLTGGHASFYDGMMTYSTFPGKAICRIVWNMDGEKDASYLERALSGVPENFEGKMLEVDPEQQTMLDALVNILTAIRQADVVAKVKNVDVSNISNATFTYDAIYEVDFGSGVNADYKINKLISIVSQLEEGVKGRIDLSKEGRTHFIPA